jgi:hypothetical protein
MKALGPAALLAAAVLVGAGCGGRGGERSSAGSGSHPPVFQSVGPFYRPPQPLPAGAPGELIRSEALASPTGFRAWRILYHSRNVAAADIAVSGFVVAADTTAPQRGRPAIAYTHGVRGLANQCAPSNSTEPLQGLDSYASVLKAGAVLVATDYPGLGASGVHPYLVGDSEAQSALDAVRAAHHLPRLEMNDNVVVFGDTQGGHAALFAGQIASTYAPELHILGVAAEDPVTDPLALARHSTTAQFGVETLLETAAGYSATDPASDLPAILTPLGVKDLELLHHVCDDALGRAVAGQSVASVFLKNPVTTPPWSTGLAANTAGAIHTSAPLLIVQGTADPVYPSNIVDQYVRRACGLGDTVDYRTFPDIGHAITITSAPQVLRWITDRLASRPAANTCHP